MISIAICILFIPSINYALPTAQEQKLLSEIALCMLSGKANWQSISTFDFGSSNVNINSQGPIHLNYEPNEIMDVVNDINSGYTYINPALRKLAKQQTILGMGTAQPFDIHSEFNPSQIYEWESNILNAPKVYNIDTGKQYTLYTPKQIKAEQGLKAWKQYRMSQNNDITNKLKNVQQKLKISASNSNAGTNQVLKKVRLKAFKDKLAFGSKLTVGLSAVINIKLLINGDVLQYFGQISKDLAISTACTTTGMALEEVGLDELAPGVSVVVFGVIDLVYAAKTGDYSRFGLNVILNTGSAVGLAGGAWAGAAMGTFFCPGIGTTIGGVLGGLIGGVGTRVGLGYTPLGSMTEYESQEAIKKIADELNPELAAFGVELDTTKSFEELQELLEKKEIPLKFNQELVNAQGVSYSEIANVVGNDLMTDLLETAGMISPELRVEGLKQVKRALGC